MAEDDDSMRRFIEIVLKKAGYEVVTAEDGLTAMQLAIADGFDAVVADAIMPNLSGYDLCRMLRQQALYEKIPLIIMSGLEQKDEDNEDCIADIYLLKGANLKDDLLTALDKFSVEEPV